MQVRKNIGRREVMELKIRRLVSASSNRPQGWETQHQLCPCGFYHFYGHLDQRQGAHPPPVPAELERERHSPAPNSKGSSEVSALDLKRALTGKGIFKCQIHKNLHQFFPLSTFSLETCKFVLWIPVIWVSANSRAAKHHIHISKAAHEQSRSRAEHYSLKVALITGNEHLLKW